MDKKEFKEERLRKFQKEVLDVIFRHIFEPGSKDEITSRMTDVTYGLCLSLAAHINLLLNIGDLDEGKVEPLVELIISNIRQNVKEYKSMNLPFKEFLKKIMGNTNINFENLFSNELQDAITFRDIERPFPDFPDEPPQKIKDLSRWIVKEVFKTLSAEGLVTSGEGAAGEMMFNRDNNGKMIDLTMRVKFFKKEDSKKTDSEGGKL